MTLRTSFQLILALGSSFCLAAFGQAPATPVQDRVFHFAHTQSAQDMMEITTVIRAMTVRSVTDTQQVTVDTGQRSLMVRGDAAQIALVEWLFKELDQVPDPQPDGNASPHEYLMNGEREGVVHVIPLPGTGSTQSLQEAATMIRSIAEIRRVFTYNAPKVMVVRGTADQAATADWLAKLVNQPPGRQAKYQYQMHVDSEPLVRVFYLTNTRDVRDLQEVATLVRAVSGMRRLFTYNQPRMITVRGTQQQVALAEWLVKELDQPNRQASPEYRVSADGDDIVRVFYVPGASSVQSLQETATLIRSTTMVRRLFTYNAPRAIALRGTGAQIAQAEQLLKERQ